MAKVNPPIAALAPLKLPKQLIDLLNQLWLRTGGFEDFIETLDYTATAEDSRKFTELRQLTKHVGQQALEIEELRAEINLLRKQLEPKQLEEFSVIPLINQLQKRLDHLELQ